MAQQTVLKRSAAAAGANTDTTIFTPAAGIKTKLLTFSIVNEGAAGAANGTFELRYGSNIIAASSLDAVAPAVGFQSKPLVLAHEFLGDGVTTVVVRNVGALAASQVAAYTVAFDSNY